MNITKEGAKLLAEWEAAKEQYKLQQDRARKAKERYHAAANAFGEWLCPTDMKPQEIICVPVEDYYISVEQFQVPDTPIRYEIRLRERSKAATCEKKD